MLKVVYRRRYSNTLRLVQVRCFLFGGPVLYHYARLANRRTEKNLDFLYYS